MIFWQIYYVYRWGKLHTIKKINILERKLKIIVEEQMALVEELENIEA